MEPGKVVARDDEKGFAAIQDIHPEGAVHWLIVPFENYETTEAMINARPDRFAAMVEFAVATANASLEDYPDLEHGFTIKFHFGAYESLTNAKIHLLSVE
jgi:diadenosine tetraphosphate (Ap4A) HIT family hydrolase